MALYTLANNFIGVKKLNFFAKEHHGGGLFPQKIDNIWSDPADKPTMVSPAQTVSSLNTCKSITEEISKIIFSLKAK